MVGLHLRHREKTGELARQLRQPQVYSWLVRNGYFPEAYVLPPCFIVIKTPRYGGKKFFLHTKSRFAVEISEYVKVQFPKTELTDRTFGVVNPKLHSDVAKDIAKNWRLFLKVMFHKENVVSSYSFPIPIDLKNPGELGKLRGGRMIYEYIEMAENDLATMAYRYKYLMKTDVKNFYPSIYTHSIAWALHGKKYIKKGGNRYDFRLVGNRLDKLFRNMNDGCTNGIPIGPVVSDMMAELILSSVDLRLSRELQKASPLSNCVIVRFKDDYRVLCKDEESGRSVLKKLQLALKEFNLELNDSKTETHQLPDGLFRGWVSQYYSANPYPKRYYDFKRFKEVCLAVMKIEKDSPGTGVIERFLADLVTKKYRLRMSLTPKHIDKVISLLLMLATLRTKAFPKVLAIIEAIIKRRSARTPARNIVLHLKEYLEFLRKNEEDNKYLIAWIVYFMRSNGFDANLGKKPFKDSVVRAVATSRLSFWKECKDFQIFQGVKASSRRISLLRHLDVFQPQ